MRFMKTSIVVLGHSKRVHKCYPPRKPLVAYGAMRYHQGLQSCHLSEQRIESILLKCCAHVLLPATLKA